MSRADAKDHANSNSNSGTVDAASAGASPQMISTLERKRMILERRRQRRHEAQQQQLFPTNLDEDINTMSSISTTSQSAVSSSLFSLTNVVNKRSGSISNGRGLTSASAAIHNLNSKTKNLERDDNDSNSVTPKAKGKRSLFGAVMERTTSSVTPTKKRPATSLTETSLSTTPQRNPVSVRWEQPATRQAVTTPQQQSSSSSSYSTRMSPGGFGLLRLLDSVRASPFVGKTKRKLAPDEQDEEEEGEHTDNNQDHFVTPQEDEWHQANLHYSACSWDLVDWSLKRKVRLELCYPGTESLLPVSFTDGTTMSPEQESMQLFTQWGYNNKTCNVSPSCAGQWEAARLYWQYPAIEEPSAAASVGSDLPSIKDGTQSKLFAPPAVHDVLTQQVRGREALLQRLVRLDEHSNKDDSLWRERQQRRWQESFRSLYFQWLARVDELQSEWGEKHGCIDAKAEMSTSRDLIKTCFYCLAPGQVVLFRIATRQQEQNEGDTNETERLVPMVVLSSTCAWMRSKLVSMGATLYLENDKGEEQVFDESILNESADLAETLKEKETEHKELRQELEALRRAQAHGETTGAEISVSVRPSKRSNKPRPQNLPPLYLLGQDDCNIFFELYLNTISREEGSWRTGSGPVPVLLSRGLGPFRHASLQSLRLVKTNSRRRRGQGNGVAQEDDSGKQHSFVDVRGPILPCAIQELVGAAAGRMMDHSKNSPVVANSKDEHGGDDDNEEVGSHYFVLQATTHDGRPPTATAARLQDAASTTGSAGCRGLNRVKSNGMDRSGGKTEAPSCGAVKMAVWDIARPNVVAYKRESQVDEMLG